MDEALGRRRMAKAELTQADYTALAEFRFLIRAFLEFSENAAKKAGLTPRHHQALLVVKGYGRGEPITIGELAERLKIRHNTAVELANRLSEGGLIVKSHDNRDHRRVLIRLTDLAERHLADLSKAHIDELSQIKPMLEGVLFPR